MYSGIEPLTTCTSASVYLFRHSIKIYGTGKGLSPLHCNQHKIYLCLLKDCSLQSDTIK